MVKNIEGIFFKYGTDIVVIDSSVEGDRIDLAICDNSYQELVCGIEVDKVKFLKEAENMPILDLLYGR